MTLQSYYEGLQRVVPPKTEFVNRIAERCNLNVNTVRLWVKGKSKPEKKEHIDVLVEETGINAEHLFVK